MNNEIIQENINNYDYIKQHKAYKYALDVVEGRLVVGKYIKKECQKFVDDIEDENCKYFIDVKEAKKITNLTKLVNMATGIKVGTPAHDSLGGFQWYFILNALCWKHKEEPIKRRYEKSILLIGRKSGKVLPSILEILYCKRVISVKILKEDTEIIY